MFTKQGKDLRQPREARCPVIAVAVKIKMPLRFHCIQTSSVGLLQIYSAPSLVGQEGAMHSSKSLPDARANVPLI